MAVQFVLSFLVFWAVGFWLFWAGIDGREVVGCMWTFTGIIHAWLDFWLGLTAMEHNHVLRHVLKRVKGLLDYITSHYNIFAFLSGCLVASLLPIFPKQRVLQNRTLAIQVHTPILSLLISPLGTALSKEILDDTLGKEELGVGTRSGLTPSTTAVPMIPINEESQNPGFDRSTRYHRTGLNNAKVSET